MKTKVIRLMVSYPVPRQVQLVAADRIQFDENSQSWQIFEKNILVMIIFRKNYASDLIKSWETESVEGYDIYIN